MGKVIHHLFSGEEKALRKAQDQIASDFATLASEKNIENISVETVIQKAEVSRGTFYKCFSGLESLSQLTAKKLTNEVFTQVIPRVQPTPDIAVMVAAKTRLGIRLLVDAPILAKLILKIKWPNQDSDHKILRDIKKDVEQGIKQGRFSDMPSSIGVNIIFNTLRTAIQEMILESYRSEYENQAIYQMLLGLGVDAESAREISKIPLSELPPLPQKGIVGKVMRIIASR